LKSWWTNLNIHEENALIKKTVLVGFALMVLLATAAMAAGEKPVVAHVASVTFDVPGHSISVTDHLTIPAGLQFMRLGKGMTITEVYSDKGGAGLVTEEADEDGDVYHRIDLPSLGLADGGVLTLIYHGIFFQSVEGAVFSRENIGNEIQGTISDEGIYMSGSVEWLAWNENVMVTHDLSFDTPAGFETVTQGERMRHEEIDGRLHTRWLARHVSDGLNLVANRYFVHEEPVRDGIVSYTFFLEDEPRLRATYMERTKAYITMYEEMIGPYPYAKFATVENWFPTGYGMPSYTLLGTQVLHLPFIPYISFGHEICHNWWGNSIFVESAEGNWCEGITVYCADYHYAGLKSPTGARDYRRTLLKDYAAYVKDPSKDFPLVEFISRHSGATRAVGYGKSMMVFHMIDTLIGRDNFLAGMQKVAAEKSFTKASYTDFMDAFSEVSGMDLAGFKEQWLTRTGAPTLKLEQVEFAADKVSFKLQQGAPPYVLQVPVVVTTAAGPEEHLVTLEHTLGTYEIEADGITEISIDPDAHIFRRLDPREIEPTISQILAEDVPNFMMDNPKPDMLDAGHKFASAFAETPLFSFNEKGELMTDFPTGDTPSTIVMNPGSKLLKQYRPKGLTVAGKTVIMDGKRYSLKDYDLVYAAANPHDGTCQDLVIICPSPQRLESLANRVGHYGKYSWLLLPTGQGDVLKGNWSIDGSPLIVSEIVSK
jgi:aminopeptidase N